MKNPLKISTEITTPREARIIMEMIHNWFFEKEPEDNIVPLEAKPAEEDLRPNGTMLCAPDEWWTPQRDLQLMRLRKSHGLRAGAQLMGIGYERAKTRVATLLPRKGIAEEKALLARLRQECLETQA